MKFKFVNGKMLILEATQLNEAEPATSTATAAASSVETAGAGTAAVDGNSTITLPKNLTEISRLDSGKAEDIELIKQYIIKIEKDDPNNTRWLNALYEKLLQSPIWLGAEVKLSDKNAIKYALAEMVKQGFEKLDAKKVPLISFLKILADKKPGYTVPAEVLMFINKADILADVLRDSNSVIYKYKDDIFKDSAADVIYRLALIKLFSDKRKLDEYGIPKNTKLEDLIKLPINDIKTFLAQFEQKEEKVYFKDWLKAKEKDANYEVLRDLISEAESNGKIDAKARDLWLNRKNGIIGEDNIEALSNKNNVRASQIWQVPVRSKDTFKEVFDRLTAWYNTEDTVDKGQDLSLTAYIKAHGIQNVPNFLRQTLNKLEDKAKRELYLQKLFVVMSDSNTYKKLLSLNVVEEDLVANLVSHLDSLSSPNRDISFEKALNASGLTGEQGFGLLKQYVTKGVKNVADQTKLKNSIDIIFDKKNPKLKADFLSSIVPLTQNGTFDWLKGLQNYVKHIKKTNGTIDR